MGAMLRCAVLHAKAFGFKALVATDVKARIVLLSVVDGRLLMDSNYCYGSLSNRLQSENVAKKSIIVG